jgi:hypothetical protein
MATIATISPATDRQISYLTHLLNTRTELAQVRVELLSRIESGTLDKSLASRSIDRLTNAPKVVATPTAPTAPIEVGMYRVNGDIFRVVKSRESGNLYAKRLNMLAEGNAQFVYSAGAIRTLTAEDRMTLAEAKAWGVEFGFCCVCAAMLTNPISVAAGIGPVCGGRV